MPAALLKMDHPCFFDFFCSSRVDDGFRLHSDFFYLFRSAGIFFGLCNDFSVCRRGDTRRNSKPGHESNTDKCKTPHHTIGIEFEVITKRGFLRPCKPPEDGLGMNLSVGFRLFAVALALKPEVGPSGFSFMRRN